VERVIAGLRVCVDELLCVGFGDCVDLAPTVFVLNGNGTVEFVEGALADAETLLAACRACPVDALTVMDAAGRQVVP
jgi:ferredoxin